MTNRITSEVKEVPPEVEFSNEGLGTMRTSGSYIALLLQLESPESRAGILVDVAKSMGITLQELIDEYTDAMCNKCGVSVSAHRDNGGGCF